MCGINLRAADNHEQPNKHNENVEAVYGLVLRPA